MKIRHVLPADNLYAVYFLDQPPYAAILKCQHRALISRREDDENEDSEFVDEIIGFVLDRSVVPADEVSEGTTFAFYVDRSDFLKITTAGVLDEEPWKNYCQQVLTWGRQAYEQRHPAPAPEVVTEIAVDPKRRKRRARGPNG